MEQADTVYNISGFIPAPGKTTPISRCYEERFGLAVDIASEAIQTIEIAEMIADKIADKKQRSMLTHLLGLLANNMKDIFQLDKPEGTIQ